METKWEMDWYSLLFGRVEKWKEKIKNERWLFSIQAHHFKFLKCEENRGENILFRWFDNLSPIGYCLLQTINARIYRKSIQDVLFSIYFSIPPTKYNTYNGKMLVSFLPFFFFFLTSQLNKSINCIAGWLIGTVPLWKELHKWSWVIFDSI